MKSQLLTGSLLLSLSVGGQAAPLADSSPSLSCDPEVNLAWEGEAIPSSFDTATVAIYRTLVRSWDDAYRAKLEGANNGLIADLSNSSDSCLWSAAGVTLDQPQALEATLKDCVFTSINAYSGPALSSENQDSLAEAFVTANWGHFRFRRLSNTSLRFDPIEAFNTHCVLDISSDELPGYHLFLAGYTFD